VYRDELEAARQRIAALEAELAEKDAQLQKLTEADETEAELVPVETDLAPEEAVAVDRLHDKLDQAAEADDGINTVHLLAERSIHSKNNSWLVHTMYIGASSDARARKRYGQDMPDEVLAVTLRQGSVEVIVHGTLSEEQFVGCVKRPNYLKRTWRSRLNAAAARWIWKRWGVLYVNILVYGGELPDDDDVKTKLVDGANEYLQVRRHETFKLVGDKYYALRKMFVHKGLQRAERILERERRNKWHRLGAMAVKKLQWREAEAEQALRVKRERKSLARFALQATNPQPPKGGSSMPRVGVTSRKKASGIWNRMPAPSPV